MTSGSFPPVSEVVPLTRTALSAAALFAPVEILTPAACPLKAFSELETNPLFIRFSETLSTEPDMVR